MDSELISIASASLEIAISVKKRKQKERKRNSQNHGGKEEMSLAFTTHCRKNFA